MKRNPIAKYLAKRAELGRWPLVCGNTGGIDQTVVIPVLAEEGWLETTLEALAANPAADRARTLVVCVVNNRAPEEAGAAAVAENARTLQGLAARAGSTGPLRLAYIDAASPGHELPSGEGVGLARKIGMDAALEVMRSAPEPLLLSLDADTLVADNYLSAVRAHYADPAAWAAVTAYAHPLEGPEAAAICAYEIFLRYHVLGLRYAGSPYAYPAIGSTITCRGEAYAAVAGMNRRQAGEDFYFLEQLAKTGGVGHIRGTCVQPSSRPSARVPFGTGPRVQRFLDGDNTAYTLYHPDSYRVLREWLACVVQHVDADEAELRENAAAIHPELRVFLDRCCFKRNWERLNINSKGPEALLTHFHGWFDALKSLRLLHHLRDHGFPKQALFGALATMLERMGQAPPMPLEEDMRNDLDAQRRLLAYLRAIA